MPKTPTLDFKKSIEFKATTKHTAHSDPRFFIIDSKPTNLQIRQPNSHGVCESINCSFLNTQDMQTSLFDSSDILDEGPTQTNDIYHQKNDFRLFSKKKDVLIERTSTNSEEVSFSTDDIPKNLEFHTVGKGFFQNFTNINKESTKNNSSIRSDNSFAFGDMDHPPIAHEKKPSFKMDKIVINSG